VTSRTSRLDVIVRFANGGCLTPEDIALIDAIRKERSILGASRATGVSYRKCWLMVDALNHTFEAPLFATFPGRRGSGAELTDFGERLVALYRSMERRSRSASAQGLAELTASLDPAYRPRASGEAQEGDRAELRFSRLRRS
jgi:molybdate transport system regulatory protein